jgi:hypothetical protein
VIIQRLVKTADLRAAAASRGASSAASSADISVSNCSGSIAVTSSRRKDIFGPLHCSFPHELRRLLMDKLGGALEKLVEHLPSTAGTARLIGWVHPMQVSL